MAFSIATHQFALKKVTTEIAASSTRQTQQQYNSDVNRAGLSTRILVRVNIIATGCMSIVILHWLAIYFAH